MSYAELLHPLKSPWFYRDEGGDSASAQLVGRFQNKFGITSII
jgi:hypothetical protein